MRKSLARTLAFYNNNLSRIAFASFAVFMKFKPFSFIHDFTSSPRPHGRATRLLVLGGVGTYDPLWLWLWCNVRYAIRVSLTEEQHQRSFSMSHHLNRRNRVTVICECDAKIRVNVSRVETPCRACGTQNEVCVICQNVCHLIMDRETRVEESSFTQLHRLSRQDHRNKTQEISSRLDGERVYVHTAYWSV